MFKKKLNRFLIAIYQKYHISFQHILYALLLLLFIEASLVYLTLRDYQKKDQNYNVNNTVVTMLRTLNLITHGVVTKSTDIFKVAAEIDPETQNNQINTISGKNENAYIIRNSLKVEDDVITYKKLKQYSNHLKTHHSLFLSKKMIGKDDWITVYTFYEPSQPIRTVILIVIIMHIITAGLLLLLIYIFRYLFPKELLKKAAELVKTNKSPKDNLPEELEVEINKLRQKIQSLIYEKTIMLSSMSHDMKNLLTNLNLLSGMVENKEIEQKMSQQLNEIQMIIDSSLAFSEGANTKNRKIFNLTTLLINLECELIDKGYEFNFDIQLPDEFMLTGYPALLKRALVNIFNNARKYAGEFSMQAYLTKDEVILSVKDNGLGIPQNEINKVLSPYYRTKKVAKTNIEGSGLGMAITATAVKFHEGKLILKNRPEGGLEVTIKLAIKTPLQKENQTSI